MDVEIKVHLLDSVPEVSMFFEVFPDEFPGIPLKREIDFGIDLLSDKKPISIPLYRMARDKLNESK